MENLGKTECLFCKIIRGEIPSEKIYEDGDTFVFLDIHPNNPGHTLVIPKKHSENLYDIDDHSLAAVMRTVQKVARAIKTAVEADGINIAMNNESAAGQVIFHPHLHVIPRFKEDGYRHWPHKSYKEGEAAGIASKIRANLS
ncbi:MAG TPA: HIT family protein [Candidatus Paceibacterota bacterium]